MRAASGAKTAEAPAIAGTGPDSGGRMGKADIGLIGLAVMGENLVLNMERNGFTVAVHNRSIDKVKQFVAEAGPDKKIIGAMTVPELVQALKTPRIVMLMIKAGSPVDLVVEELIPLLEPGDVIIDGGNSYYKDTQRRVRAVEAHGIHFVGAGVSGGEEGALNGPSIMPGGSESAWPIVGPILEKIAAKAPDGSPCCAWMGSDGAGHFVKMVHNGIEYGDMQLISEAYFLMKQGLGLDASALHDVFARWNKGRLDSFLIDITTQIFLEKDSITGKPLVDIILDSAAQKGTGRWTTESALELGIPAAMMAEAVFARCMSAQKGERVRASEVLPGPKTAFEGSSDSFIDAIEEALYASKICSYAQGFALLSAASNFFKWNLDMGEIALIWRNGCIIRSQFLDKIMEAYRNDPKLQNLLLAPYFREALVKAQSGWREVLVQAVRLGIAAPAFSSALAYYDSYRSEFLPANLVQAQRDFFGAHTFERIDQPGAVHFHWGRRADTMPD